MLQCFFITCSLEKHLQWRAVDYLSSIYLEKQKIGDNNIMQREHVASNVAETMIRFICDKRIAKIVNFFIINSN